MTQSKRNAGKDRLRSTFRLVRLTICVLLAGCCAALRLWWPETADRIGDAVGAVVCGSSDYGAALACLGEAFTSDVEFGEAAAEAAQYAFGLDAILASGEAAEKSS